MTKPPLSLILTVSFVLARAGAALSDTVLTYDFSGTVGSG
jgi:hypothetical protein